MEECQLNYAEVAGDFEKIKEDQAMISLEDMKKVLIDHLFMAKALILRDRHAEVDSVLDNCLDIMKKFKINRKEIIKSMITERAENKLDGSEEYASHFTGTK